MRETVRVRISSDAAGAISLTPVVVQEMPFAELLDHMVSVCGKDAERIAELLRRGSLVSGTSRFRWEGWVEDREGVLRMLARFPDPDPSLPLRAERCTLAVLQAGTHRVPVPREAAEKRRLFKRRSFWEHLLPLSGGATYVEYSYREKADVFRTRIDARAQASLIEASHLLTYDSLARQLRQLPITAVDFYVTR